jgi:1-acyl-sn-glycerol-3-phosphate acyltransferase
VSFAAYRRRAPNRSVLAVIFWWVLVRSAVRLGLRLLYRQRCRGRSNVPAAGHVVFVANHQSHYDPPIVGCLVGPFASLARASLFPVKPWGWIIRQTGGIPLHRGRSDAGAMRAAINELKTGGRVLLFPEGTRSRDGAVGVFRPGMLVLVRRTGAPVVPVAIEGAYDVWSIGRRYPKLKGRICVKAACAIAADDLLSDPPEIAMERLRREIDGMRLELRRELRQATGGRYPAPGPGDGPYWERTEGSAKATEGRHGRRRRRSRRRRP